MSKEFDIKQTKQLRKDLDIQLQILKGVGAMADETTHRYSRERSISITKIQEAIMWLGMDLKALNEPNPYPESYNPENTQIEPAADNLKL